MKRNISLIFSLLFIFSACQKEEVEEYVSGARLNFNNDYKVENVPTIRCSFTDSDYLYHGGDECAVLPKFCWSSAYIG